MLVIYIPNFRQNLEGCRKVSQAIQKVVETTYIIITFALSA